MGSYLLSMIEYTINTGVSNKLQEYTNTFLNNIYNVLKPNEREFLSRTLSQKHIDELIRVNYGIKVEEYVPKKECCIWQEDRCVARTNTNSQCSRSKYTDKHTGITSDLCMSHSRSAPYGRIDQEPLIKHKKKRGRKTSDIRVVSSIDKNVELEYVKMCEIDIPEENLPEKAKEHISDDMKIDENNSYIIDDVKMIKFFMDEKTGFVYMNNISLTIVARIVENECHWFI